MILWTAGTGYSDEVSELHTILTSELTSEASLHDKGVACRRLAVIGTDDSIPILEKLLSDVELSHLARVALEAIPSKRVDAVFRRQLESAHGNLLVGIIDSIGNRRDAEAVPVLLRMVPSSTPEVQAAILYALSDIATMESSEALRNMLKAPAGLSTSLLADCVMRCADRLANDGNTDNAIAMYQLVRSTSANKNLLDAATLAMIRLSKEAGLPLLADLLRSSSDSQFASGLQAARLLPADHDRAICGGRIKFTA